MLIGTGAEVVAVGVGLLDVPLVVPYIGWAIWSVGRGIVFPTIPLSVIGEVEEGREAGELSSTVLMDYPGVGIGTGLAGVSVALADDGTISIEAGLAGAFGVGIAAAVLLALVARRLPLRAACRYGPPEGAQAAEGGPVVCLGVRPSMREGAAGAAPSRT